MTSYSAHRGSGLFIPAIACARPALTIAYPFAFRAATPAEISKVLIKFISCAFVVTQSIQLSNIVSCCRLGGVQAAISS